MNKKSTQSRPVEGAGILLAELDQIVARRPAGNPVLPPMLFVKPSNQKVSAAQLIPNCFWVSASAAKPTIPHALSIADRPEMDDLALFTTLYENLKIPRSMGRFHFHHLKMAIDLLGQTLNPDATSREMKINDLASKLYRASPSHLANRSAQILSGSDSYDGLLGLLAVAVEGFRRLRFRFFRTKLATTTRYRWFTDRIALELTQRGQADEISQDFLNCAIWTLQQPRLHNSALARELLMLALFEDLEQAFKPRPINLSWHRRWRTTPFIVTLKEVSAADSAARRFLQTFGELMDQSKGGSLLILASVNGQPPASLTADIDSFHTAADKLQLIRSGRYESSAITAFNIQVSATPKEMEAIRQLVAHRPTPKPKTTWRDFTLLMILLLASAPFLLAGIIYAVRLTPVLYQSTQNCKYMYEKDGEVVGITDGSCSFLTENDARSIGYAETENPILRQLKIESDRVEDLYAYISSLGKVTPPTPKPQRLVYIQELNDAKQAIFAQNRLLDENENYRTIVLLLPFTAPDESGHANQKTVGIMRGVAVAQEEINANANRASRGTLPHLKLKVLIANTGDRLAQGPTVAEDIRELNNHELTRLTPKHSIVAVVGITQSIAKAKLTVSKLTRPGDSDDPAIPVIGSTLTYDYMSEGDPLFFQAAAPNKRQAKMLAEFIKHQPIVGDAGGASPELLRQARELVIVSGDNDLYSQNLADDLYGEFLNSEHTVLGNWAMVGGDERDADPHLKYKATVLSLSDIQTRLCDPAQLPAFDQEHDVVVYTGRSQNFSTFLSALKPDVCARGKGFTIVAGSDIAQWGEYETYKNFFPHLYFGAYGSRGSDHNGAVADNFFANPTVKDVVDQSGAARAYDSIKLVWSVVQNSHLEPKRIDTTAMTKAFRAGPRIHFEGASGVLKIPAGEQVPTSKPVFIMRAGHAQPVLACGEFSIQSGSNELRLNTHGQPFTETKWGSGRRFDCPL